MWICNALEKVVEVKLYCLQLCGFSPTCSLIMCFLRLREVVSILRFALIALLTMEWLFSSVWASHSILEFRGKKSFGADLPHPGCYKVQKVQGYIGLNLQTLMYWKQGNYSLRRPPKLTIPQAVIGQRWATVNSNLYVKQTCMYVCMTHIPALTPS